MAPRIHIRGAAKVWLAWLGLMSANACASLSFDEELLDRSRWLWVHEINSNPYMWACVFGVIAVTSFMALLFDKVTCARIALGVSIPINIIFGLSVASLTWSQGTSPGIVFDKWFTTSVVSAYLLTQPLGQTPEPRLSDNE